MSLPKNSKDKKTGKNGNNKTKNRNNVGKNHNIQFTILFLENIKRSLKLQVEPKIKENDTENKIRM